MTTTTRSTHRRSIARSIERGLDRMTMDQTTRIRRMRKRMERMDQAPVYDARIKQSITRSMKHS